MSVSDSLKAYYDREWKRLQTEARVFSKAYPEQAGHLHLDAPYGRDPNIDHLLQGCTYLAAQIHHHIDQIADALPTQLMMQLWPQLLQDVPSFSIAQWQMTSRMSSCQRILAKTPLVSKPVGDEQILCRFETVQDLTVYPFDIHSVTVNHARNAVTVVFEHMFDRPFLVNEIEQLSFYLSDDHVNASTFYQLLRHHCDKIELVVDGISVAKNLNICFPIMQKIHGESDWLSHQYVFYYFCFFQQYFILSLSGFSALKDKINAKQFEVMFHFDRALPSDYSMNNKSILLNTTLMVNQFSMDCEPIELDHSHYHYPIVVDRQKSDVLRILSIESVHGMDTNTGLITNVSPLSHLEDVSCPSYTLSRRQGDQVAYDISCFNTTLSSQILSIKAKVCQGDYPKRHLLPNSLSLEKSSLSHLCRATNILTPTQMLSPAPRSASQDFIQYFMFNLYSLKCVNNLKKLLHSLNWSNDAQHKRRIEGIISITAELTSQVHRGAFANVIMIQLQLKSDCFISNGDMYLFGDVLYAFFSAQAALGQMIALTIVTYPQEDKYVWAAQYGKKQLI